MSNFNYLKEEKEFANFADTFIIAEQRFSLGADICAIQCCKALEISLHWLYDKENLECQGESLIEMIEKAELRRLAGDSLCNDLLEIARIGHKALHTQLELNMEDALKSLKKLFNFSQWLDSRYSCEHTKRYFDKELLNISENGEKKAGQIDKYFSEDAVKCNVENKLKLVTLIDAIRKTKVQNSVENNLELARSYESGDDKQQQQAFLIYKMIADQNNIDGKIGLADCYALGIGTPQNYHLAFELYRQAAKTGHERAVMNVGKCYMNGDGVNKDLEEAIAWYKQVESDESHQYIEQCLQKIIIAKELDGFPALLYRKSILNEDVESQYQLGMCYKGAMGVELDYDEAFIWFKKAACQHHTGAIYQLGKFYEDGLNVNVDKEKAFTYFSQAAQQEYGMAEYEMAEYYRNGVLADEDTAKAKELYEKASVHLKLEAELGDAEVQYILGDCYFHGYGVEESNEEAVKWYLKGAQQDNPACQRELGFCYKHGCGVEKSDEEAMKWYSKAVEWCRATSRKGNAEAQYMLGYFYKYGYGVEFSYEEALKWFRMAAGKGVGAAQNELDTYDIVEEYRVKAEQGDAESQSRLAILYYYGYCGEHSDEEIAYWFHKAAEQGHADAKIAFDMYMTTKHAKEQAEQGVASGQRDLGIYYFLGRGIKKSIQKGFEWSLKAAEQGDSYAQFNVGEFYYFGVYVDKSISEATKWYEKAAIQGAPDAKERLVDIEEKVTNENFHLIQSN